MIASATWYVDQAGSCLARAYGDVSDNHEQDFWHARAQVYATLAVAQATADLVQNPSMAVEL